MLARDRAVFWVAVNPAVLYVVLLVVGVREPERAPGPRANQSHPLQNLRRLGRGYWWVVALGAIFAVARFSEAFLVLRLQQDGLLWDQRGPRATFAAGMGFGALALAGLL